MRKYGELTYSEREAILIDWAILGQKEAEKIHDVDPTAIYVIKRRYSDEEDSKRSSSVALVSEHVRMRVLKRLCRYNSLQVAEAVDMELLFVNRIWEHL